MATENLKSGAITNRDATPPVPTTANSGMLRRTWGVVEAAGGDAGSTYRICQVPSNARGIMAYIATDDLGTGLTAHIGVYQTTKNGGAAVDADFFADAVDVATAAVALTNVTFERLATRIADFEKPLWEQLGLTADPGRDYDIVLTSVSAAATGTILGVVDYVL